MISDKEKVELIRASEKMTTLELIEATCEAVFATVVIPKIIEDEYVYKYLWERALIAINDPCARSHPHENMNAYCHHKTEIARNNLKDTHEHN